MIEFWIALAGNVKTFVGIAAACVAVAALFARIFSSVENDEPFLTRGAIVTFSLCFVGGLVACVPDMNDIWKVRVAMIKYELASPENVKAASETIERIGHKLECKYLGTCDKETEK